MILRHKVEQLMQKSVIFMPPITNTSLAVVEKTTDQMHDPLLRCLKHIFPWRDDSNLWAFAALSLWNFFTTGDRQDG